MQRIYQWPLKLLMLIYVVISIIICVYLRIDNSVLRKNLTEISDSNVDHIVNLVACKEEVSDLRDSCKCPETK